MHLDYGAAAGVNRGDLTQQRMKAWRSAFVFQGLFTPNPLANQGTVMGGVKSRTLGCGGKIIWNTSWAAADKATLESRDTAITNAVVQTYGHTESTPHNPWGK